MPTPATSPERIEWMANIAHDAVQPANAILLGTEVLLRSQLDDEARDTLRRIRASTVYLVRLMRDLADLTRIDEGRLSLSTRAMSLGGFVEELIEVEHELWPQVTTSIEDRSLVVCDPDRVRQVLENLVSNAIKYGSRDAAVSVGVTGDGRDVDLVVTNRGRGIAPADIPIIFERHARTPEACASGVAGGGPGLCIARRLVEVQGGRLWVESIVDDTTRFHVTFPRLP